MIAVYGYPDLCWRLVEDTPENREIITAALKEVGTKAPFPAADRLDALLKTAPTAEGIIDCTATVFYTEEW